MTVLWCLLSVNVGAVLGMGLLVLLQRTDERRLGPVSLPEELPIAVFKEKS